MTAWKKLGADVDEILQDHQARLILARNILPFAMEFVKAHGRYPKRKELEDDAWSKHLRVSMKRDDFRNGFDYLQRFIDSALGLDNDEVDADGE